MAKKKQSKKPSEAPRALIIIPTYNELENLPLLLDAIFELQPNVHILVVDDNSPDGTGDFADEKAASDERVHVMHRQGKQGLGTAYIAGFKWALAREYTRIFEMDADFSHQPKYLEDFLAASDNADLVLGCRYMRGGGTENWTPMRKITSQGGNLYARAILGLKYKDLTGGFKCFRREVLEAIDLDSIGAVGYAFQIELTYRAHKQGFRIAEVPIIFPDRERGESKMSTKIVREAMVSVVKLRFN